jgi:hypothetical protein
VCRQRSIETHCARYRQGGDQRAQIGGLGIPDRRVEATLAFTSGNDVPKPDAGRLQGDEPVRIGEARKVPIHDLTQQPPEGVPGMGVVATGGQ